MKQKDIQDFATRFWGFGKPHAPLWFVGPEPGGGANARELRERVEAWTDRGGRRFEHLQDYHRAFGESRWFSFRRDGRPAVQRTWKRLIRTYFSADKRETDLEAVREFQSSQFCGDDTNVACYELSALPARGTSAWPYDDASIPAGMRQRRSYENTYLPLRLDCLGRLVDRYTPFAVVFYSDSERYLARWCGLSDEGFKRVRTVCGHPVRHGKRSRTHLFVMRHPNCYRLRDQYFDGVGRIIAGL